jgi:malate synthase
MRSQVKSPSPYAEPTGVEITGSYREDFAEILSPEALAFVATLHRRFNPRRKKLLYDRELRQQALDQGEMPRFPADTLSIREGDWRCAPLPDDLQDRRVEITGPVDRKMVINALNSGASMFMADFEDSNSPSWQNCVEGQINLRDAIRRTITFEDPKRGKYYELNEQTATLLVRPRGWHLKEKHMLVDGEPVSASLFDFGLYFFHNAKELLKRGSGPYFYLPKLESHLEARLWNEVFILAQSMRFLPLGTIKATVLLETIMASFEMDEILYELRDHSAGLNCGRWDYIFSYIKRFRKHPDFVTPDRSQIGMTVPFMKAYTERVIQVCHKRGVHAMGGMAAQIPIKSDPQANQEALAKVQADKEREAKAGHDGTWVAHPGLVATAMEEFNKYMHTPNQIHRLREDVEVSEKDLLEVPTGYISHEGIRINIDVGIRYLAAWLNNNGCVPIYHLMEDAATAEICRTQLWQWLRHEAVLKDGSRMTLGLYRSLFEEMLEKIRNELGEEAFKAQKFPEAAQLFDELVTAETFTEFLTLPAYERI